MNACVKEIMHRLNAVPQDRQPSVLVAVKALIDAILPPKAPTSSTPSKAPLYLDFQKGEARRGKDPIAKFNPMRIPLRLLAMFEEHGSLHFLSIVHCGLRKDSDPLHRFQTEIGTITKLLQDWGVSVKIECTDVLDVYRMRVEPSTGSEAALTSNIREAQRTADSLRDIPRTMDAIAAEKAIAQMRSAFAVDPSSIEVSAKVNTFADTIINHDPQLPLKAWAAVVGKKRAALLDLASVQRCVPDPCAHDRAWASVGEYMGRMGERITRYDEIEKQLASFCVKHKLLAADLVGLNETLDKAALLAAAPNHASPDQGRVLNSIMETPCVKELVLEVAGGNGFPKTILAPRRVVLAAMAVRNLILEGRFRASPSHLSLSGMKVQLLLLIRKETMARIYSGKEDSVGRERPAGQGVERLVARASAPSGVYRGLRGPRVQCREQTDGITNLKEPGGHGAKRIGDRTGGSSVADAELDDDVVSQSREEEGPDEPLDTNDPEYRQDMAAGER